ncbi:MAG: ankyrin repeat domain-containing protein [Wolbachia sp.]
MWAATNGHKETVETLLKVEGIDVNVKGQYGYTTLQVAAEYGKTDVVKLLLDKGASINAADKEKIIILLYIGLLNLVMSI